MAKCPTCHREQPKSNEQRNKFHAMCREIGNHIGLSPGKVKESIKADYFGFDEWAVNDKWYRGIRPSESAGMAEYADLISFTLQWASENCGLVLDMEAA